MSARQLPESDYLALRAATRQLVRKCGGGNQAAAVTRVGQQELSTYGNPNADKVLFMPADVIADLEAECTDPVVTRALADLSGHVLVPVPNKVPESAADLVGRVSKVLAEVSDVSGGAAMALGDGTITKAEAKAMHKEVVEALQAIVQLDTAFKAAAKGDAS